MAIFLNLFFRQRRPGKYLLPYSKTEKRLCRVYKEEVQKVEKLTFFQSMVLVQKWPFFFFFFRQYRPRSWVFRYSRTKKCFSKLQKQDVEKVKKWRFVERSVFLILVKNWPFFHVFILGNIGQENVFFDILEEKMSLSYKNKTLKKSKNWDFLKGAIYCTPSFW